jgi:hypothetical protein
MLRFLARLMAVMFAVAFVVCALSSVFFRAASSRLTQPLVYKDAFVKERFYDQVPALAAGVTVRILQHDGWGRVNKGDATEQSAASVILQLSQADRELMFGVVLPPEHVRRQTDRALEQFFGWMHSNALVPEVSIELGEFKQRMTGPEIEETYVRILRTKPPCAATQLKADGSLPVDCCPSTEEMPQVRRVFRSMMQQMADQVPETIDLFKVVGENGATGDAIRTLTEVRRHVAQLQWLASWSPVAPALLLLLIAVFAVRSLRSWMLWWGIPCLLAGLVGAALALAVVPVADWINACVVVPNIPFEASAAQLKALDGLVTAIVRSVMDEALRSACVLAVVGLVAVLLGVVFGARSKPAAP